MFGNLGVDLAFDGEDLLMKGIHQCPIHLHTGTDRRVCEAHGYAGAVGVPVDTLLEVRQVVLGVGVLDVRLKLCVLASQVQSAAEKIPGGAHALRIDIGHGKHPASKQGGNLVRVDLVVLGFPAVDGFHVQSMAEHESDSFPAAQIRDPVPGEDTLHGHHEIFTILVNGSEQSIGTCAVVPVQENLAGLVLDADIHRSCVQVYAAVVLMLSCVESH